MKAVSKQPKQLGLAAKFFAKWSILRITSQHVQILKILLHHLKADNKDYWGEQDGTRFRGVFETALIFVEDSGSTKIWIFCPELPDFLSISFFLAKSIAQKLPNSDPGSIFAWTFGWRNPEIKMCFPSRDIWHLDHQKMAKIEIWTFLAVFEVQYFDNWFRTCYQTWCPKGFRREQQFPAISFKIFKDPAELWRNWTTSRNIWHFEELGTLRIRVR